MTGDTPKTPFERHDDAEAAADDEMLDIPAPDTRTIKTAVVFSPNAWAFLMKERLRRGKGWNISMLVREAVEAHFGPEARDEVERQGSYDRTEFRRNPPRGDGD